MKFLIDFWKLLIPANIFLKTMIYILTVDYIINAKITFDCLIILVVRFLMEKIKFPKSHSRIFHQNITILKEGDNTQCDDGILNKISKAINQTFAGLKCMSQVFRICFL